MSAAANRLTAASPTSATTNRAAFYRGGIFIATRDTRA